MRVPFEDSATFSLTASAFSPPSQVGRPRDEVQPGLASRLACSSASRARCASISSRHFRHWLSSSLAYDCRGGGGGAGSCGSFFEDGEDGDDDGDEVSEAEDELAVFDNCDIVQASKPTVELRISEGAKLPRAKLPPAP